jgi:hypothetical protein
VPNWALLKCNTLAVIKQARDISEACVIDQLFNILQLQVGCLGSGIAQSVERLATGWKVRGSITGVYEIFRNRLDRPWGPPSLLYVYNGNRVSFPRVKRPGRGVDHPPPFSAECKESVEVYLYSLSGPSWPVIGWPLPLPLQVGSYVIKQGACVKFSLKTACKNLHDRQSTHNAEVCSRNYC